MPLNRQVRYLDKAFEILLLVIFFLLPLAFSVNADDPFWVVEKFFLKFSVSILSLVYILRCIIRKEFPVIKSAYTIPFIVLITANLAGVFVVSNIYAFADRVQINIYYIIIFYLTAWFVSFNENKNLEKVLIAILGSAFVMGVYGLIQSSGMDFLPWKTTFNGRAASTLGNPNFLAGHMILIIPLTYVMFIVSQSLTKRFVYLVLSVVMTVALLASQTRGAYAGYIISLLAAFILMFCFEKDVFGKNKKVIAAVGVVLFVLGGLFFSINKNAGQRIADIITLKDDSAHIRVSLWKNSMYLIKDNILLGTGPGNFYLKYPFYQSKALTPQFFKQTDYYKSGHSHNDFIQFVAEYGIIGAGALFAFFWMIFYSGIKYLKKSDGDKALVIGALGGISALMVHAFFNFPFQIIPTTVTFFALAGLAAISQKNVTITNHKFNNPEKVAGYFFILIFITATVLSVRVLTSDFYLRKAKEAEHFVKLYEAASFASDAADLNPWNDETVLYYAQILEKTGNHEKSFNYYKQACTLNPGSWEGQLALFNLYAIKNDIKGITDTSELLYKISPYSEKAISSLGYALYLQGKINDAIDVYDKGIKAVGESASLLSQLSACYGALGNVQKTLEFADKAVAIDPQFTDAYYNIAVAQYRMKNSKKAVENLNKILSINPTDEKAKGLLKVIADERKK